MTNDTDATRAPCAHCGSFRRYLGHPHVCDACDLFVVKRATPGDVYGACCVEHKLTALAFGLREGSLTEWWRLMALLYPIALPERIMNHG